MTSVIIVMEASSTVNLCRYVSVVLVVLGMTIIQADEDEHRLVQNLMKDYNPRVRPALKNSETVNVTFGVALAQIIDVDERNQIITTNCWINQGWIDYKLSWNPHDYSNITAIRLPYEEVWKPDILLYNNAAVRASLSSISTNVIVTASGNITWLSMWIFKSSCSIDVRYFPFDKQNCSLNFASWTYSLYGLNLVNIADEGDISNYVTSSEWELLGFFFVREVVTFSCCPEPYPFIRYDILIKRRPLFYVFNMMMPCVLITLVALLGFYMPPDSGEKISMGITTLLSMTVFLMIVAESMPPTSDVVPLIGLYYGITIAIVSTTTGMTVFTLNIHHKGTRGTEIPHCLKKICFNFIAKVLFIKIDLQELPSAEPMDVSNADCYMDYCDKPEGNDRFLPRYSHREYIHTVQDPRWEHFEQQFGKVLHKVYQTIQRNEIRQSDEERREIIKHEWQQLALVIDRLLLACFLIATMAVTLTMLVPDNYKG